MSQSCAARLGSFSFIRLAISCSEGLLPPTKYSSATHCSSANPRSSASPPSRVVTNQRQRWGVDHERLDVVVVPQVVEDDEHVTLGQQALQPRRAHPSVHVFARVVTEQAAQLGLQGGNGRRLAHFEPTRPHRQSAVTFASEERRQDALAQPAGGVDGVGGRPAGDGHGLPRGEGGASGATGPAPCAK